MNTRSHTASIIIAAKPEAVFRALHTPSAICKWWLASRAIVMPEIGGLWSATWGDEDDPDYITAATMHVFDPPRRIVMSDYRYRAKSSPMPFQADFTTEFLIEPHTDGSKLTVTQDGFPCDESADGFYAACEKGWHDTLNNLKKYFV